MLKKYILSICIILMLLAPLHAKRVLFDIPYSKQYKAYSCGQNSFRMAMAYWHVRLPKSKIFLWTGYRPTSIQTFKDIIDKKYPGFATKEIPKEPGHKTLISELDKKHPVLLSVEAGFLKYLEYGTAGGHMIVIIGYNPKTEKFFLRDPNSKNVEKISYSDLSLAWTKGRTGMSIYSKKGKPIKQKKIKHFNKANRIGDRDEPVKPSPAVLFIPSLYLTHAFNIDKNDITEFDPGWTLNFPLGISLGHQSMDKTPLLPVNQSFEGISASLGFSLRSGLFAGNDDNISTGAYNELKNTTLNVFGFTSIKSIKNLTLIDPIIQVSGYKDWEASIPFISYHSPKKYNFETGYTGYLKNLKGIRASARMGLTIFPGFIGGGFTYNEFDLYLNKYPLSDKDIKSHGYGTGFDMQISSLDLAFYNEKNKDFLISGQKVGLSLMQAIPPFRTCIYIIPLIRILQNSYYVYEFRRVKSEGIHDLNKNIIIESYSSLPFFDFLYEFKYSEKNQHFDDGPRPYVDIDPDGGMWAMIIDLHSKSKTIYRHIALGLNFNQYLPYFQLQLRSKIGWTEMKSGSFLMDKTISAGIYAGLF